MQHFVQAAETAHQVFGDPPAEDSCQQSYIVLHHCMLGARGMKIQSNNLRGISDFAAMAISFPS